MNKNEKEYWEIIWKKFKAGDKTAFETIYYEYIDALFAYGTKITPNQQLVEDAIQDLFINIYSYGKKLKKPQSLEYYLYKTLKHLLIKKIKENYRYTHPDKFIEKFDLNFKIEKIEEDNSTEKIINEIKNLDDKKREILFLKFNSGLTYKEIGELLNIKPGTVKKQVFRIIKLLRKKVTTNSYCNFLICSIFNV